METTLERFTGWNDTETPLVGGAPRAKQAGKFGLSERAVESHEQILSVRSQKHDQGQRAEVHCLHWKIHESWTKYRMHESRRLHALV